MLISGFPGGGSDSKESACNVGDPGFDPWVGKIPWRRAWQPTPVFLPGESSWTEWLVGYSPWAKSWTRLSTENTSQPVNHTWLHLVIFRPCNTKEKQAE